MTDNAKLPLSPEADDAPAIVCAWCVPQQVIRPGTFPASHGICPACEAKFDDQAAKRYGVKP
jgi:hypothetical protein